PTVSSVFLHVSRHLQEIPKAENSHPMLLLPVAIDHVVGRSTEKQMKRIYAPLVIAVVADVYCFGDRPPMHHPRKSMGKQSTKLPILDVFVYLFPIPAAGLAINFHS